MEETRISQLLPSVKCSDCGEMVEFRRLGEHLCKAAPAVPSLPNAYKKPMTKTPFPSSRQDMPSMPRPNLNPLSVPDDNGYDVGRSPYDTTPSPTDSGYSGYSGSKYTSPPSSTSSPKGPTNFLQKYEQVTGKQIGSSSQSPRSSPTTSPIENNYSNGFPATTKRPQDNFNVNNNDYPNAYDNRPRDPYGQNFPSDRGMYDQRKQPNNDRYNQQPPFNENNNYNMDDPYLMGKPRVPNDPNVQQPDFRNQIPNDRYNNNYNMRGDDRNRYDQSDYGNKYPPPPSSNQPYLRNYDSSREPTYDRQNGQPRMPPPKQYMPPQGNKVTDPYDGRRVDDLMDDLMREMDSMQMPSKSNDICAYCKTEITSSSNSMWALGKTWHSNHLLCAHCRKPIDPNVGHVEREGNVYCPKDFASLFLPKCRRCNLPVEREAVSASDGKLEGKWHVKCFGCHTCYKPFPDKSFYVFENAPYCRRHYHKLNNSLCRTCDEPIEGPCVQTIEGWRYHPSCFVCFDCQTPLTNIYYSFDNKQYCETHIMVIKRSRKIRAEKRQTMFRNI